MIDFIKDHLGELRKLGRLPTPKGMMRAGGATNICDWREKNGLPRLIPRSQWQPIDFITGYDRELIENQRDYGACSAATETGAQNRQRAMRGKKYERLSWPWLYDQCNGGGDNGSNMGEISRVARKQGVPQYSLYTECKFRSGINPPGAIWYKEGIDEITASNFDEYVTCLLMGILVQHAIDGNSIGRFNGDGVCIDTGRNPNHSVYSAALKFINGLWVLGTVNSWDLPFGPFGEGWCYTTEKQLMAVADTDDAVGHIVVQAPTQ